MPLGDPRTWGLSVRARKVLLRMDAKTFADVTLKSLDGQRNCGYYTIAEIMNWKHKKLNMTVGKLTPHDIKGMT